MWRWIVLLAATVAANVLFKVFNRFDVAGRQKHWPRPTIFYANHRSFADPFVILFGCLMRPLGVLFNRSPAVWSVAYAGHFRGWRRHLVKPCRIILRHKPEDPANDLAGMVAEMAAVLKRGEHLLIFPEGEIHRGRHRADLAPFKKGLAWLVRNCNATVIPVAVMGTDALMPEGLCLPRMGRRIQVVFGDAVPSAAYNSTGTREITAELEKRLKELLRAAC